MCLKSILDDNVDDDGDDDDDDDDDEPLTTDRDNADVPAEFVQSLIAVHAFFGSTPLDSTDTNWGANSRH